MVKDIIANLPPTAKVEAKVEDEDTYPNSDVRIPAKDRFE